MANFDRLSIPELAAVLRDHAPEFGDEETAQTLCAKSLLREVEDKTAVIEAVPNAIAVVRPERDGGDAALWLLYVAPAERLCGVAKEFVRSLRQKYEYSAPMGLVCSADRVPIFSSCGFMQVGEPLQNGSVAMISDFKKQ